MSRFWSAVARFAARRAGGHFIPPSPPHEWLICNGVSSPQTITCKWPAAAR